MAVSSDLIGFAIKIFKQKLELLCKRILYRICILKNFTKCSAKYMNGKIATSEKMKIFQISL